MNNDYAKIVQTKGRAVTLKVTMFLTKEASFSLIVRNHSDLNSIFYISEMFKFKEGKNILYLNIAKTSEYVKVSVHHRTKNGAGILIKDIEEVFASKNLYTDAKTLDFIVFAKEFAEGASDFETGFYQSDNGEINVSLQETINNMTPARINRKTGLFQVAKRQFDDFSVEMRMFILLHEWFHYKLNSKSEFEVDLEALRLFLALGLAPQEAIKAMTNVFKFKSVKNTKRIQNLIDYIKFFKK